MRVNDVVASAIQAACRLPFRQMHRECPILVGRRKAAIPGFVLHSCRKHDGNALCTILVEYLLGRLFVQVHPVEMAGDGVLNIILAGDIRAMGEPEKLQLAVLARISCGFVVYGRFVDRFHISLLFGFLNLQVHSYDFPFFLLGTREKNIQLILHLIQMTDCFKKTRVKIIVRCLRRELFLPLHQLVSVRCQLMIAVGYLMMKSLRIAHRYWRFWLWRFLRFIDDCDTEIGCNLQCSIPWRQVKQTGCKVNHIAICMTPKAMKAFIDLHAWIMIRMEWTSAHAISTNADAIMLCCLSGGNCFFH